MFGQSTPLIGQPWYRWCRHFLFVTITPVIFIHNLLREGCVMNSSFCKIQVWKMALTSLREVFKSSQKLLSMLHDLQLLIGTRMTALGLDKGSQFGSGLGQTLKLALANLDSLGLLDFDTGVHPSGQARLYFALPFSSHKL